tara:strand:+ start:1627 stop:2481 length:855 start_codon:yes stop_codon:yes gene_type:complete
VIILKRIKVAILGSNGFIGKALAHYLKKNDCTVLSVSSEATNADLVWNYDDQLPESIFDNDFIIDCSRSPNAIKNISRVKNLLKSIPKKCTYLFFSSEAINKSSNNLFLFFRGDDYIREKKILTKYIKKFENALAVYPDIVLGSGGTWSTIFNHIENAKVIKMPNSGNNIFKYIDIKDLCEQIFNGISSGSIFSQSFKLIHKKMMWKEISKINVSEVNKNFYFNSYVRNLIISLLNSVYVPDYINFKAMNLLRKKNTTNIDDSQIFEPSGMTRFYMSKHETNEN